MAPPTRVWHQKAIYDKIVIGRYARAMDSNHERLESKDIPTHTREITDQKMIGDILSLLDTLPTDGGMMKSFVGEVLLTQLYLCDKDGSEEISIYDGHLKTPSTGFFYQDAELILEKKFIDTIDSLLEGYKNHLSLFS